MKNKTEIVRVQLPNRIEEFCNPAAARRYAITRGGVVLSANEPAQAAVQKLGSFSSLPVYSPGVCGLLGRPQLATQTEFATAYRANGSQAGVLKTAAVREALIQLAMREQNFSRVRAEAYALARYPKLHTSALSKVGTGANEKPGMMKPSNVRNYLASTERQAANEIFLAIGCPVRCVV